MFDTQEQLEPEKVDQQKLSEFLIKQEAQNTKIAAEVLRLHEMAEKGDKDAHAKLKQLRAYIQAQEAFSGVGTATVVAPEAAPDQPNAFQKLMRSPVARIAKALIYTAGDAPIFFGYSPVDFINIAEAVTGQDFGTGEKLSAFQRIYRGVIAGVPIPLPTGEIVPLLDLGVSVVNDWRNGNRAGAVEKIATVAAVKVAGKVRASRSAPSRPPPTRSTAPSMA